MNIQWYVFEEREMCHLGYDYGIRKSHVLQPRSNKIGVFYNWKWSQHPFVLSGMNDIAIGKDYLR